MNDLCPGCGASFPVVTGPSHPYMESSAACWAAYGEVLARQYTDPAYASVLQLTVDAYAAQHPGRPSPQSIQSVARHLISLCLTIEHGASPAEVVAVMQRAEKLKPNLTWLTPPWPRGEITVANLLVISDTARYLQVAREWPRQVWESWSVHHPTIHDWVGKLNR